MNLGCFKGDHLSQMRLLFYARGDDQDGKRLQAAVRRAIPEERIEVYHQLDELTAKLGVRTLGHSIVVILAADGQELENLQALKDLLRNSYVILAIPDWEERFIELAHRLLPRFLCQKEGDFTDIEKVLSKMLLTCIEK